MIGVMAALAAALAWTTASGLWRSLSDQGSALQLNALKNGLATLLFLPVLALLPWQDNAAAIAMLLLSGGVGIAAGDSFYLAALRRLGTRRTLTLEAVGPVLASLGSVMLMGERLGARAWVGALLVAGAVVLVADSDGAAAQGSSGPCLGSDGGALRPEWRLSGETGADQQRPDAAPDRCGQAAGGLAGSVATRS